VSSATARGTLGVAVVGLGVGEQHARRYHANPSCELRWLVDHDLARAQTLAAALGGRPTSDFDTVVRDDRVDIVSIASYDHDHYDQVMQALRAGKHVFVEKPLCQTLEQARAIKAAWERHEGRVKLDSNLVLRAAPLYRWLRDEVRAGTFGDVYAFTGEYLYGRIEKITQGWRKDVPDYSVMEGGGIHLIDLMMWVLGERPVAVYAAANRIATRATAFQPNDYATAVMEMGSGILSTITANFGCVHRHHHVVRVFGTSATLLYDDAGARLHHSRAPDALPSTVSHSALPATKGDLIDDFVAAVLTNSPVETSLVFDSISISVACDRSAATNARQVVEYL
jgi:predicted dehydrogenase